MVRPRAQQIENLKTRYSRFSYTPQEFASQQTFIQSAVYSFTVTDAANGADTETYANYVASIEPYAILAGDSISIAIDGAGAIPVLFASTDTTASRIAVKINTDTSSSIATAESGYLKIQSPTLGENGSITIADVVPGTLAKLGLIAGTVVGTTDPVRGVVTRSVDGKGGKVLLRSTDGKCVESDASAILPIADIGGLNILSMEKPGGLPLYSRLTALGSNFVFKYYTEVASRPIVNTFGSNFSLLDGTDTFNISATDAGSALSVGPVAMTFPAGPGLTRDQVVDRINALWNAQVSGSGTGEARVRGCISGPFSWASPANTFLLSVDGGADQLVTFLVTDNTAAEVASRINVSTTGCTASVVTSAGKQFIQILSDDTDAASSSLELKPPIGGASDVFKNLGIPAGKYLAPRIALPSGPSEIQLVGIGRGNGATLVIASVNPATLTRMGISAGTFTGSDDGEEEVDYPIQDVKYDGNTEEIIALIPEVMDFGEVPTDNESSTLEFINSTPGDNVLQSLKNIDTGELYDGLGIRSIGKSANTESDGSVSFLALKRSREEYENVFKQIITADFNTREVSGLVANLIETGTGNPLAESNELVVDIDPDDDATQRGFRVQLGRDGTSFSPFNFHQITTAIDGITVFADFSDDGSNLSAIANSGGTLRFYDSNTEAAGAFTGGNRVIPLTSGVAAQGDSTLRLMNSIEGNQDSVTLFRQINAKFVATVGDGTNSFGDFNGANAIQQAMSFFNSNIISGTCHIQIKRGTYTVNVANSAITAGSGVDLILEGEGATSTIINLSDALSPAIATTSSNSKLTLKNLTLSTSGTNFLIQINADTGLHAHGIVSTGVSFRFEDGVYGQFKESAISAGSLSLPLIQLRCGDGTEKESFVFEDCVFTGLLNQPILRVGGNAGNSLTPIRRISFNRCKITCGGATVTAGNLTGNPGVLDVEPTFASLTGFQGAYLRRIEWIDCEVTGNTTGAACTVLMHLLPITNASATIASPYDATTSISDIRIDDVVISGGRWYMPPGTTTINPFTIGLAVTTNSTDGKVFGRVTIKDWIFEVDRDSAFTSFSQGSPTQDIQSFFTSVIAASSGPIPVVAEWAAVAISAMELNMNNVKLNGFGQLTDSGELFIKADRIANINNIYIDKYTTGGPGAAPRQRVRTRFGDTFAASRGYPKVSISNVIIKGTNTGAGVWYSQGAINHEPSTQEVVFENISIFNFLVAGGNNAGSAFRIVDGGSGDIYNSSSGILDGLVLKNMVLKNHLYGIFGSFSNLDGIRNLGIYGCDIRNNTQYGVNLIFGSTGAGNFIFNNNTIVGNNIASAIGGVLIQVSDWSPVDPSVDPSSVVIVGNQCFGNGNAGTVAQFALMTTNAGSATPVGIAHGNNFTTNGLDGTFKINRRVAGVSTAMPSPEGYASHPFRGCETGYQGETAGGFNVRVYRDTGNALMQNVGRLESP